MFNVENAIQNWKRQLRANNAFEDGDIAELESHLREEINRLMATGLTEEEAFDQAEAAIGTINRLNEEWDKTRFKSHLKQQEYMFRKSFTTLLPTYMATAFRNIRKRFGYSLINIIGLSTGLATCILILFFVIHEFSYDTFYTGADRIYRIVTSTEDDGTPTNANGIFGTGPLLKKDYPDDVEAYGRIRRTVSNSKMFVGYGENRYYEDRFYFADPGFLRIFNFPLVKGDTESALARPNTILVTESTAQKYFGEENPIGKTLTADPYQTGDLIDFEVVGVLKDLPRNTHFRFDFLASYTSQLEEGLMTKLNSLTGNYTYIKLAESVNPGHFQSKLTDFLHRNWREDPWYSISIQPLLNIHLDSQLKSEMEANGNRLYTYVFGAVAVLILVIAGINFINLATARSTERAQEVGVRKALGAQRSQLIIQFLGEALAMTLISGILALFLVQLFLPVFNELTQKHLQLIQFLSVQNVLIYLGALFLIGTAAGLYPALVLSSFKSIDVLKDAYKGVAGGGWLRKALVVSQFSISAILIISTIIIYQQIEFIKNKPLGYASEQIITLPLNPEAREHFEVLKSEWLRHSGVINVTSSSTVPTSGTSHSNFDVSGLDDGLSLARYYIDEDFLETYDLNLVAGTDISTPVNVEGKADFMVSRKAVNEAGLENPEEIIGRRVNWLEFSGTIKGVVNDMILYDLRHNQYSIMFLITPVQHHKFASIRVNMANVGDALNHIESVWNNQVASYPIEYTFLDEKFEAMHDSDRKMAQTVTYFAILAIAIACLGLFGLAAYLSERKRKEIGIRKVLGATIPDIIRLMSVDFMKLIFVALFIGIPIAYWGMNRWLQGFAFKVEISPVVFMYAGLILLTIAFVTISYQSIKSATMNPVNSLRNE